MTSKEDRISILESKIARHHQNIAALQAHKQKLDDSIAKHERNIQALEYKKERLMNPQPRTRTVIDPEAKRLAIKIQQSGKMEQIKAILEQ